MLDLSDGKIKRTMINMSKALMERVYNMKD